MPDPSRHAQNRNWIESILRYIPGFRGYLEKEYRRESDQLARNWLADQLQRSKTGLDQFMRGLIDSGQIAALPQCDRLRAKVDRLISEFRSGVRGYSGIFDFVRVREDLLDEIYRLDMALMEDVQKLAGTIEQLPAVPDSSAAAVANLLSHVDEVQRKFSRRDEMLQGLAPN